MPHYNLFTYDVRVKRISEKIYKNSENSDIIIIALVAQHRD